MKSVVVYDSWYDNTRQIAEAIAKGLGRGAQVVKASQVPERYFIDMDCELLAVGSPTHGGTTTPALQDFLKRLNADEVNQVPVAAFDTRVRGRWLKVIGFASQHIANQLQYYGGTLIAPPEGFYVHGKEGPLLEGETARAEVWGAAIAEQVHRSQPIH